METKPSAANKWIFIIPGILILFGLYLTTLYNYLLFHSIAELFIIVVACGIFIVAWNSRRFLDNNYLLFIGIAYLFIAVLELIHTLAYTGMGIFKGYGTNLATQLWIAARYMESLSLLIAPLFLGRRIRLNILLVAYASATCLIFLSIFSWNIFPVCFVEGTGLTPFKKISEYIICLILIGSLALLFQKRKEFEVGVYRFLIGSIVLTIAAELAFTFYIHAYGFSNLIGHYFTIISFYLIYKAVIETGLVRPYDLLFRNLKQSEDKIRNERDRSQRYLDVAGVIIVVLNADQTVALINKKGCEILGYEESEIIGNKWFDNFLPERDRNRTKAVFVEMIAGRVESVEYHENYVLRKDNKERLIAWRYSILRDDDGKIIATLGSGEDITENRRAEEALRESEEKYRSILESIEDGYYEVDIAGNFTFFNDSMCRILGYSKNELMGMNNRQYMDEENAKKVFQAYNSVYRTKKSYKAFGWELIRKDGSRCYVETSVSLRSDSEGKPIGFQGIARDITERKRMEEGLLKAQKLESVGILAGGIAHEFNNILGAIIGNTELAINDVPESNPARDCLKEIQTASLRAKDLVRQLLGFARKSVFQLMPVHISPVIREAMILIRASIPATIEIRENISCESDMVMADSSQISLALLNLCVNAKNAMQEEGGVLEVRLENTTLDEKSAARYEGLSPGNYVKMTVRDTGHGIDPKIIGRIFDPYFTSGSLAEATGMGLAVVDGIVKHHNGAIAVESEPGKGTVFEVLFPLTEAEAEQEAGEP
jgi:PAS domain S-box-containing protein